MSGQSGYIRILNDISENGSWYIMEATQKDDTAGYSGVKISAWAKWKDGTEEAGFDIPVENIQKSHSVPASCTELNVKQCLANNSGITIEADNTDGNKIDNFLKNGVKFEINMKDDSAKTYDGGLIYNNETLITLSCLFDEPVQCEDIKNVKITER